MEIFEKGFKDFKQDLSFAKKAGVIEVRDKIEYEIAGPSENRLFGLVIKWSYETWDGNQKAEFMIEAYCMFGTTIPELTEDSANLKEIFEDVYAMTYNSALEQSEMSLVLPQPDNEVIEAAVRDILYYVKSKLRKM
jgi:hypothetical protein